MISSLNAASRFGCGQCGNPKHVAGTPIPAPTGPRKAAAPVVRRPSILSTTAKPGSGLFASLFTGPGNKH